MPVRLNSSGGGSVTLDVPSTASAFTATLPASTGNVVLDGATQTLTNKTLTSPNIGGTIAMNASVLTLDTAKASTSGTFVDFTNIPSWVKRITLMFDGVSTNSTSPIQVQIGDSGGIETSGYLGCNTVTSGASGTIALSAGFLVTVNTTYTIAAATHHGLMTFVNVTGNQWAMSGIVTQPNNLYTFTLAGTKTLSSTLDRIRVTTANGTDTFDAGTINVMWE